MWNEIERFVDGETGVQVTRFTSHASNHLYFTNSGWIDGGRSLVFCTDRPGATNLGVIDLATGDHRLMSEFPEEDVRHTTISIHPDETRAFGWRGDALLAIDLSAGTTDVLFRAQSGWVGGMTNVTADGAKLCFMINENLRHLGFEGCFEARPKSKIMCVDLGSGEAICLHERDCWMAHVNTSPADAGVLSFCHEGPWGLVENRVWGLEIATGRVWKIRETAGPPECVGHEYWLADGKRIAYHGWSKQEEPILGIVDVHTGETCEHVQPVKTKHTHSLDGNLIVGDGSEELPWILLWKFTPEKLEGPWKLCRHDGGWSEQRRHVHPRISPDGKTVVFTSDKNGEPNVFVASLPEEIETLPRVEG